MTQVLIKGKITEKQFDEFKKALNSELTDLEVHQILTKSVDLSQFVQFVVNHLNPIDLTVGHVFGKVFDAVIVMLSKKVIKIIKNVFKTEEVSVLWIIIEVRSTGKLKSINLYVPCDPLLLEKFFVELENIIVPSESEILLIRLDKDKKIQIVSM